jgi:hypothetical protein
MAAWLDFPSSLELRDRLSEGGVRCEQILVPEKKSLFVTPDTIASGTD